MGLGCPVPMARVSARRPVVDGNLRRGGPCGMGLAPSFTVGARMSRIALGLFGGEAIEEGGLGLHELRVEVDEVAVFGEELLLAGEEALLRFEE